MNNFFSLCLMVAVCCMNAAAQPAETAMPVFQFTKMDGSGFDRSQVAAGQISFFVFIDTDCDHCQRAMQYINRHYREFSKVSVYIVSMSSPARINQFMDQFGKTVAAQKNVMLLQDTRYDFISKFKPRKSPGMFLYSADKKLLLYGDDEMKIDRFLKRIKAGR